MMCVCMCIYRKSERTFCVSLCRVSCIIIVLGFVKRETYFSHRLKVRFPSFVNSIFIIIIHFDNKRKKKKKTPIIPHDELDLDTDRNPHSILSLDMTLTSS